MAPRPRPALLALLSAFALGCGSTVPSPDVRQIEPSTVRAGQPTKVTVSGSGFRPQVQLDFDRPAASGVDSTFQVLIGDAPAAAVTWVDEQTLSATVPGTLNEGVYDVKVVDPRGKADVLAGAFTVVVAAGHLSIEDTPGGSGAPVAGETLAVGTMLGLYAVARADDGSFLADVTDAGWTLDGPIGELTVASGGARLHATTAGVGTVTTMHPVYGTASTGPLSVASCAGPADCADACHSTGQCVGGACTQGPADRDADHDGFVDAMCVGGTDCDDTIRAVNPSAVEAGYGTAVCSDGLDNDCDGLRDAMEPACARNSAPIARLAIEPPGGTTADTFTGTGAPSSDRESTSAELSYAWDWDDDGVFEATGLSTAHAFATAGLYTVSLKVTDPQGLFAVARFLVVVGDAASTATVTTGVDEANPGATPAAPGGAGFSLREAIAWSAATPGRELIVIPAGTVVALSSRLDVTSADGVVLIGDGAVVDGRGVNAASSSCLDVSGNDVLLLGLEVHGCKGGPLNMHGTASQATRCSLHDNRKGVEWAGTGNRFGPGNRVWANGGFGIELSAPAQVLDNVFTGNTGAGISVKSGGSDSELVGNVLTANGAGIDALAQCQRVSMRFNTVQGNTGAGVSLANNTSGHRLLNSIVSDNGGWGIDVMTATFAAFDANDFSGNGPGACRACSSLGLQSRMEHPGYLDAAGGDLRIDLLSPLVDAAIDTGDDRTPGQPGNFLGAAPDIGAYEIR